MGTSSVRQHVLDVAQRLARKMGRRSQQGELERATRAHYFAVSRQVSIGIESVAEVTHWGSISQPGLAFCGLAWHSVIHRPPSSTLQPKRFAQPGL